MLPIPVVGIPLWAMRDTSQAFKGFKFNAISMYEFENWETAQSCLNEQQDSLLRFGRGVSCIQPRWRRTRKHI